MTEETIYKLHDIEKYNYNYREQNSRHFSKTNTIHVISDKSMIPVISGKFMWEISPTDPSPLALYLVDRSLPLFLENQVS